MATLMESASQLFSKQRATIAAAATPPHFALVIVIRASSQFNRFFVASVIIYLHALSIIVRFSFIVVGEW